MKRRVFLKSTIATGSGFVVSGVVANNVIGNFISFNGCSPTETKKILMEHYNIIFKGNNLDINALPNTGKLTFSESFDIEMTDEKVSIFDIAEAVIEKTRAFNFDASSLREGKIPEGMIVSKGSVTINADGSVSAIKLAELKNFDAQMVINQPIIIKYKKAVAEWKNIKKIEPDYSNEKFDSYVDSKNIIRVFKFKDPLRVPLTINSVNPLVINENEKREIVALDQKLINSTFLLNLKI